MLGFLKSAALPWIVVTLLFGWLGYLFYAENTKQKIEDTKKTAIENPAEKKVEVVEREVIKYITKEGETKVVTREVIKTVVEKKPEVPVYKIQKRKYYVSGAYGITVSDAWNRHESIRGVYGIGGGYNFTDWLSAGVRLDTIGQEYRLGVEMRINF